MLSFLRSKGEKPMQGEKLNAACSSGDLKSVASILKTVSAVDINYTDEEGRSPLLQAARSGHLEIVRALLAHKEVSSNLKNKVGCTALLLAINEGHFSVVDELLRHPKVDVHATDENGWTALMYAAENGHFKIVKLLLAQPGVNINLQSKGLCTALIRASLNGHLEVVKLLLAQPGVDVNVKEKNGLTARTCGKTDQIKDLIRQHPAYRGLPPPNWRGAASHTTTVKNDTAKEITSPASTFSLTTKTGGTSVNLELANQFVAAAEAGDTATVRKLLSSATAAEVNYEKSGWTALMAASHMGHLDVVKLLLSHPGVDVNALDHNGRTTALMKAAHMGHLEIVKLLLAYPGVDVNAQDKNGRTTALMKASLMSHLDIVKLILAHPSVDVNVQNENGRTVFMSASSKGQWEIVALLLAHPGLNVNVRDKDGRTSLDIAKTDQIKDLIRQHEGASPPSLLPAANIDTTPTTTTISDSTNNTDEEVATSSSNELLTAKSGDSFTNLELADHNSHTVSTVHHAASVASNMLLQAQQQKELTDQDRAALESFLASYTPAVGAALHRVEHLDAMAGKLAAHDRALKVLVNKQKECPSLFWFYPKKRELRNWLSNPLKCLLQDSLMMVVVCPVTLCVVKCGPDGVGWEIRSPKAWVKKWGPAILASIYVMQAAVLAGRIVGIPLPTLPSVGEMVNVLGLHVNANTDALKGGMGKVAEQVSAENLMHSFGGFASVTEQCLEEHNKEMGRLIEKMQLQQKQHRSEPASGSNKNQSSSSAAPPRQDEITLDADMPTAMIDASYHSIHTFLTTGENAMLGKLEDQLRGSMERVMAEDGEVEWVSVQAVDVWRHKHAVVKGPPTQFPSHAMNVQHPVVPIPSTRSPVVFSSWLAVRLRAEGTKEESIVLCENKLIHEEEFTKEHLLGAMPHSHFTMEYLNKIGITAYGLQQKLITIHRELAVEYQGTLSSSATATPPLPPMSPLSPDSAASFTSDEKDALQKELAALKNDLYEMKSNSAKNGSPLPNQVGSNSSSGGGGLKLKQRNEASTINPLTGLEYSMDELIQKVAVLEASISGAQRDIGHLGSVVMAHDADLESHASSLDHFKGTSSHTKGARLLASSLPMEEHTDQKKELLRKN